jgi:hypothetical protein
VPDETLMPLPELPVVLDRALAAAGGSGAMLRHKVIEESGTRTYDNHGVIARLRISGVAPARREERESWTAAGRDVGRIGVSYDGLHGSQYVSFQGTAPNDAAADRKARIAYSMHPLLELRSLCTSLRLTGYDRVSYEAAYVLECKAADSISVRFYVSVHSGRVLRREFPDQTDDYGDYRFVDGELVPFVTVAVDASGTTTTHIRQARFDLLPAKDQARRFGARRH